jgi:hypothetical protein
MGTADPAPGKMVVSLPIDKRDLLALELAKLMRSTCLRDGTPDPGGHQQDE